MDTHEFCMLGNGVVSSLGNLAQFSSKIWGRCWRFRCINQRRHWWKGIVECQRYVVRVCDVWFVSLWKKHKHLDGIFVITASAAVFRMQVGRLRYHISRRVSVPVADWLVVSHRDDGVYVHCLCPQAVRISMSEPNLFPTGGSTEVNGDVMPKDVAMATKEALLFSRGCRLWSMDKWWCINSLEDWLMLLKKLSRL